MRSVRGGGPAALATSVLVGGATKSDGTRLTNDQGAVAGAATTCGRSWLLRTAVRDSFVAFVSQHVRRACPCEEGGQQQRLSACARIIGQDSAAATEVVAIMPATKRANSRRTG